MVEGDEVVGNLPAFRGVGAEDVGLAGAVEDECEFLWERKGALGRTRRMRAGESVERGEEGYAPGYESVRRWGKGRSGAYPSSTLR